MTRPIQLVIDPDAMARNLETARAYAPAAKIWAVAKANAYGHGIDNAVIGFKAADGLAVLDLHEAQQARAAGWLKPILLMEGVFSADELGTVAELGLSLVVHHAAQVALIEAADVRPEQIWIKLNTGMNRLGFDSTVPLSELQRMARILSEKTGAPIGWMTHFANADRAAGWKPQHQLFLDRMASLSAQAKTKTALGALPHSDDGPSHVWRTSLANSAALLTAPEALGDWVRPGVMLYGATPFAGEDDRQSAAAFGLVPAQSLMSQIIAIQQLNKGDAVGYGGRFIAPKPMRVGVVAAGYADGYPRIACDGTPVWVHGRRLPMVGQVSMDMLTVDLTDHPQAGLGSPVELWGRHIPIDEVAHAAQTVGYELMCKVTTRVARVSQTTIG